MTATEKELKIPFSQQDTEKLLQPGSIGLRHSSQWQQTQQHLWDADWASIQNERHMGFLGFPQHFKGSPRRLGHEQKDQNALRESLTGQWHEAAGRRQSYQRFHRNADSQGQDTHQAVGSEQIQPEWPRALSLPYYTSYAVHGANNLVSSLVGLSCGLTIFILLLEEMWIWLTWHCSLEVGDFLFIFLKTASHCTSGWHKAHGTMSYHAHLF